LHPTYAPGPDREVPQYLPDHIAFHLFQTPVEAYRLIIISIGLIAVGEVVGKPKTPDCITEVALFVPNDFPTWAFEHPALLALPGV